MVKTIQIRRHARANNNGDITRGGKEDAERLGEELRKEFGDDFEIVTSPVKQALQTAQAIGGNDSKPRFNDLFAIPKDLDYYLFDKTVEIMNKNKITYTEAILHLPQDIIEILREKSKEIIDYLKEYSLYYSSTIVITHSGLIEPIIFTVKSAWVDGSFTQRIGNLEGIELWVSLIEGYKTIDGPDDTIEDFVNDPHYGIINHKLLHFY